MENLRIIEQSGFQEVTMPCAACFNRHKAAQHEIRTNDSSRQEIAHKSGYDYQDKVVVHTVSETILNHLGVEEVNELIKKPLKDLNLVCYYGCLLTRPPAVTEVEHPENPVDLDQLMEAAGANVIDWSYKTMCCGASHSLSRPDIVIDLSRKIIKHAKESGAEAIVVACPLCHMNLDARQFQMKLDDPMPILYFTQLLALALNLPEKEMCLNKNLVDPRPVLTEKRLL
jgi:heterodisulfide reductase subunit B